MAHNSQRPVHVFARPAWRLLLALVARSDVGSRVATQGRCPAPGGAAGPSQFVEVSMSKGFKILGVVIGVALVAAVALGALIFTQPAAAAAVSAAVDGAVHANTANGGGAGCGQAGLDAAAKALNMTTADLQTQLRGGATLSDLATKANVKLADV